MSKRIPYQYSAFPMPGAECDRETVQAEVLGPEGGREKRGVEPFDVVIVGADDVVKPPQDPGIRVAGDDRFKGDNPFPEQHLFHRPLALVEVGVAV
ncbi:MAG: hypothetical protein P9M08_10555, partial [Candidatus Erginobacter occultus]|nr:hypothetical protein [Candidatus Erginobacter occultus]